MSESLRSGHRDQRTLCSAAPYVGCALYASSRLQHAQITLPLMSTMPLLDPPNEEPPPGTCRCAMVATPASTSTASTLALGILLIEIMVRSSFLPQYLFSLCVSDFHFWSDFWLWG